MGVPLQLIRMNLLGPLLLLFSFGSQCCDDAVAIGIIGDGHHLGVVVNNGEVVNNLVPS